MQMTERTARSLSPLRLLGTAAVLLTASLLLPSTALAAPSYGPLPKEAQEAFRAVRDDRPPPHIVRNIHYVISNENRHYLYRDALQGQGGVYVGVGTDQNYLLAAWSRPEVLVLMDFDQVVVDLHRVYKLAFLKAQTPQEFMDLWKDKNKAAMKALIDEGIQDPALREAAQRAFHISRSAVNRRLLRVKYRYAQLKIPTFLSDAEQYGYVVDMFKNERVYMVRGDLTADRSVNDIAVAARKAGMPVRTLYLSNAERYFHYNADFRSSMLSLPFDAQAVVLRTSHFTNNCYQYTAQSGANFHSWLRDEKTSSAKEMLAHRQYRVQGGLAMMALTPDKVPPPIVRTRSGDKVRFMEARRAAQKRAAETRAAEESLGVNLSQAVFF